MFERVQNTSLLQSTIPPLIRNNCFMVLLTETVSDKFLAYRLHPKTLGLGMLSVYTKLSLPTKHTAEIERTQDVHITSRNYMKTLRILEFSVFSGSA